MIEDGPVAPARPEVEGSTEADPTSETGEQDETGEQGETAPRWFELVALTLIVALATVGATGLLLAVSGRYTTAVALAIGVPLAAVALVALYRGLPSGGTSRAAHLGGAAALVLAVAYVGFAGLTPSQNVVLTRDPGSYVTTAQMLANGGTLEIDARDGAFDGIAELKYSGAAVYNMGGTSESGNLQMQFNHLAPVALAVGSDLGGYQLMFRLPALMAGVVLLALYAVTVRVTRRPYLSLLAPAVLGVCTPLLYVARNTYSETFAAALLWGAILVLVGLHRRPLVSVGLVGGVLLGAVGCTRVDALLYVGMVFPLAAISIGAATDRDLLRRRVAAWAATVAATIAVGAIGWFDLTRRSGGYAQDLGPELSALRKALVASAVLSVIGLVLWRTAPMVRRLARRSRRPVALGAAVLVGAALLFGWLVRPELQTATRSDPLPAVEALQRRDGLPVEPGRTYAEDSLRWMAWYLGIPGLAAALGGLTVGTWRMIRGRADAASITVTVLGLGGGALYWYNPSITPDQLWAARRFVPAVLPALTVAAVALLALVTAALDRRWRAGHPPTRRTRRAASSPDRRRRVGHPSMASVAVVAVATVAFVVPPAATTHPVRWQRLQAGYLQPVLDACDVVGDDAAIIVLGAYASITLQPALRAWCDVPVAAQGSAVSPETLPALARAVRANGYRLFLITPQAEQLSPYVVSDGPPPVSTTAMVEEFNVEQTLTRPPSSYVAPEDALTIVTPFALHVLAVDVP